MSRRNRRNGPVLEREDAREAWEIACKAEERNTTRALDDTGDAIIGWHAHRWDNSPACRALEAFTLCSFESRRDRLSDFEAWDLATILYRRDAEATEEEIEGMERQCDLDRVLVLPLLDPVAVPFDRVPTAADALTVALFNRAADRTKPRKQKSPKRTHRELHRSLAGETYDERYDRIKRDGGMIRNERAAGCGTVGALIPGCPWCAEVRR